MSDINAPSLDSVESLRKDGESVEECIDRLAKEHQRFQKTLEIQQMLFRGEMSVRDVERVLLGEAVSKEDNISASVRSECAALLAGKSLSKEISVDELELIGDNYFVKES